MKRLKSSLITGVVFGSISMTSYYYFAVWKNQPSAGYVSFLEHLRTNLKLGKIMLYILAAPSVAASIIFARKWTRLERQKRLDELLHGLPEHHRERVKASVGRSR